MTRILSLSLSLDDLWGHVDSLKSKCDSLENHSRRNNLLFFGIPREKANENWEESERKVRAVIQEGMGVQQEMDIERAHRAGKGDAVIVKFLSYKSREMVLKNAKRPLTANSRHASLHSVELHSKIQH